MGAWLKKKKAVFIIVGIVFVILALILVPAYTKTAYNLEQAGENTGLISVLFTMVNNIGNVSENVSFAFG